MKTKNTAGAVKRKCSIKFKKRFKRKIYIMFGWGSTVHGELGLGGIETENIFQPRKIEFTEANSIEQISCGENYTVVVTKEGHIYSCGNNDYGQLGHEKMRKRLQLIPGLDAFVFKKVACGSSHTLAVNEWGELFSWGCNQKGQLGLNCVDSMERVPRMVKLLATKVVVQIACGAEHSIALTNDGELYSWGSNKEGQLGLGYRSNCELKPLNIRTLSSLPISFIACGGYHTIAISKSGVVYAWGRNNFGQLGLSDTISRSMPCQLPTLKNVKVCYAACGEEFSVFLTRDGGVFTCGAGMYGQLGHGNNVIKILLPRQVMELMGSTVTQICCGKKHTLALVPSRGRVYAWGLGGAGQLGNGVARSIMIPQVILAPWTSSMESLDTLNCSQIEYTVKRIFCGGDHCFVTVASIQDNMESDDYRIPISQILTVTEERMIECKKVPRDAQVDHELMKYLETVFKSQACINASFLLPNDLHYSCSMLNHGVDLEYAKNIFDIICDVKNKTIQELILTCINENLVPSLIQSLCDTETLRVYLTLPLYEQFMYVSNSESLQIPFCKALLSMKEETYKIVCLWWRNTSKVYFNRLVYIYKSVILKLLTVSTVNKRIIWNENLKYSLDMLHLLQQQNIIGNMILPHETFYISEITAYVDIAMDYFEWILYTGGFLKVNIFNYAFIFDTDVKTRLLQLHQNFQMRGAMEHAASEAFREAFMFGFNNSNINQNRQFLMLTVSRDNIVSDTIEQLAGYDSKDLKKPLRIKFNFEDAEDVGGVKKEFFMLLWRQLFNPEYGIFKEYEESRRQWFNTDSLEKAEMYSLIGMLCGLAIYNETIVNLPFPVALYKKLLKEVVNLSDLEELSPVMAKNVRYILDYNEPDFDEVFSLSFDIIRDVYGEQKVYELIPGGSNIPVTLKNKEQYVELYIDYIFNKSMEKQFKAFDIGFQKVCEERILKLFHSHELMLLLIGSEHYNWQELQQNTNYKNGYVKDDPTIILFWQVFHDLPLEEKKKFLLFLTGTDRVPIQGMNAIRITIQPLNDERFLPAAHTCFNLLDLPRYQTRERLRFKLLQAIQHTEGFSLV